MDAPAVNATSGNARYLGCQHHMETLPVDSPEAQHLLQATDVLRHGISSNRSSPQKKTKSEDGGGSG